MIHKIIDWYNGRVLYETEAETLCIALEKAVAASVSLNRARLDGASFDRANLDGARLVGASLVGASFDGASLVGARLDPIKADLWMILTLNPNEAAGLLKALREGRINGSAYEGNCGCLVGTIANVRGCNYQAIPGLAPDSSRPAEVWFLAIREGDTPANHVVAGITEKWIEEWFASQGLSAAAILEHPAPPKAAGEVKP